jgi:oxygen-dependent protoporphyrinogen oxidase
MFRPELAALPFEELVSAVMPDLRQLLGIAGDPVFARHSAWPRDVPQYNVGYGGMLQTMIACERANPGLFIGGRVRDGVSIAQSLLSGIRLADRACMYSPD